MRALRDYPLKLKLMLIITVTCVLSLSLACAGLFAFEVREHRVLLARSLILRADILGANSTAALTFRDPKAATETLATMKIDPHFSAARLFDKKGLPFASCASAGAHYDLPAAPGPDGALFAHGRLIATRGVFLAGQRIGTVLLAEDSRELAKYLEAFLWIALIVSLGASAAALALAAQFQRLVSRPIQELATTAKAVKGRGDYSLRAEKRGADELGLLVEAFNGMLDAIQERDRSVHDLNADLERRVEERTAKLEAANRELESFSYSVSHDLRAPLRSIDGFSLALLEDFGDKLDQRGQDFLQRVRAASRRMSAIIDDMLTLGRVTRSDLRRERVDLSGMAAAVVSELREREPDRRVSLSIEPGAQVDGDAHLLRLLLENLLGNAWKFTSKTPAASIEFRTLRQRGRSVYVIRDNGVGFDPAYAGKLFKPFVRLHGSGEFPGTGVGLAIVARIVERHGGRIWAESAVGRGAAFFFTLEQEGADKETT